MEKNKTNKCEELVSPETLPIYPMEMKNLFFYRVRKEEESVVESDPTSFSYIQNPQIINRNGRFNRNNEQVLYTSTSPKVAVKEKLSDDYTGSFYIGKWHIKHDKKNKVNTFVAVDENCSKDANALSRKVRKEIKTHFSELELEKIDCLRNILEKDYELPEKDQYIESSILASKIFEVADCILSYSAKDDKELNATFNKKATDNLLVLDCVYHCRPLEDKNGMAYDVDKIGIVKNEIVKWNRWEVKKDTLKWKESEDIQPYDSPQQYLIDNKYSTLCRRVNVNADLNGVHTGFIQFQNNTHFVSYEIHLIPIDDE